MSPGGGPSAFAERVLAVVERIPAGMVMSYGDIAEYLGESSARAVGQVLFRYGAAVPWHRVVMASGAPAPGKEAPQLARLVADGTPLNRSGSRVAMVAARWDGRASPARPEMSEPRGAMNS